MPAKRRLLLLLDGVAHERFASVCGRGCFRRFTRPARVISVFPTLTDPAYDLFFGTGPTPGYEAGYFDREANRMRPALWDYVRGLNEAWVRHSDYRLGFVEDGIMYLAPRRVFRAELKRARRIFERRWRSGAQQIVLYILSTDALGHMLSPEEIDAELLRLDAWLEGLFTEFGAGLDVALVSDHGLAKLPAGQARVRKYDLNSALKQAGLRIRKCLRQTGDVVVPQFGLLDVVRMYAHDVPTRERVVAALRDRPEIEVVAAREGEHIGVYAGAQAGAAISRTDNDGVRRFAYRPSRGDPLRLDEACRRMRDGGWLDDEGFARPEGWLAASAELDFPNAPQRLWEGMFTLTREQPDVVLSLSDGWFVGSGLLSRFVRMQGTHGGLHRRVTETLATTTSSEVPSPIDLPGVAGHLRDVFGWMPADANRW